ncbi:uncharacterized protein EDB91DRAFT_1312733 [Suillus paluster]|uniref:uncharacterized protein n=1 Tax=Suillus paluster TaxID=48578 RepID=UPI001B868408|nr:uncharacterized protein EDB91DRAFT_1312733 [Suillus paluster]KAG1729083.1 hypothetical protein EDB91DRAFT_1312733 [Suillus paluster]
MAPTSTLMLLSAMHSTTVLSEPFVTPSTTPPVGTTVLTHDLWKGGLVFAVAIVSVVGYFYRRRRKDTMSKPKAPNLVLPAILPRDGSVLCSPSDMPYTASLNCDHPILQSGRNQLVKHAVSTCNVDIISMIETGTAEINQETEDELHVGKYREVDVTEADCDRGVQFRIPAIAITVTDDNFVSPLSSQRALGLFDKKEYGPEHEEVDDDISIYSSESADTSLHDSLLSEAAEPDVDVPEITCEYHMTVVACEPPARSYDFNIQVVGTTLRGGAFLTLPGSLPSPSIIPAGSRSPDARRHGLVEMSDLASALAVQLDYPPLDTVLQAFDVPSVPPTARRHGQVDFARYADALDVESGFLLRCQHSLPVSDLFEEEEEDCQDINSRLMDDLLQSIDDEVEFYSSFDCDEECDDIFDDSCSANKHVSPTWDYLDFLEDETRSFAADEDVDSALEMDGCNEQFSPIPEYSGFLGDDIRTFQGSSEACIPGSFSKQGEYGPDDELTSDLQQLPTDALETSLNHVSGGTSESAILDLIRLLDDQTVLHQQPVYGSIPEVNSDGFNLLRFINEDLRLSADDEYPILDFDRDDDCDDDDCPKFPVIASDSKSSLSDSEDGYTDDYGSTPSLASASDIDSEDEEVIIAPMTGHTNLFLRGSNHRRSPAGCFLVTPGTPTQCGDLVDASSCINVTDGEPRTQSFFKSFLNAYAPFTDEHWSGIPTDVHPASTGLSDISLDL